MDRILMKTSYIGHGTTAGNYPINRFYRNLKASDKFMPNIVELLKLASNQPDCYVMSNMVQWYAC